MVVVGGPFSQHSYFSPHFLLYRTSCAISYFGVRLVFFFTWEIMKVVSSPLIASVFIPEYH